MAFSRSSLWAVATALIAAIGAGAPAAAHAACDDLLPRSLAVATGWRGVTAADLIGLRNIGSPDASTLDNPTPIVISPNGAEAAFVLTRADPVANVYCRGLLVVDLGSNRPARLVDSGGEYMSFGAFIRGLFLDTGTPLTIAPQWSRDGKSLYYLKRVGGRTAVWRVDAVGRGARLLVDPGFDAETLVRLPGSETLVFSGRPAWPGVERALDQEGRSGWLFDDRVVTNYGARPQVRERDVPLALFALDPSSGAISPATEPQKRSFAAGLAEGGGTAAISSGGRRASIRPASAAILGPSALTVEAGGATALTCPACGGRLLGVWWSASGRSLYFMRHEGWANEATALYRWVPTKSKIDLVLRTTDAVQGCASAGDHLICTSESTTSPRLLINLDLNSGRRRTVFDPNPEFAAVKLGSAERLRWRNDRGLEAWGDLILPRNFTPGSRVPMVVVQYHSRGFLRGGTNDEYPVFLFAEHGMAVLSIERPAFIGTLDPTLTSVAAIERANIAGWKEHASLFSSLETGVRAAIARGVVDPDRLGISGLSDGATVARYALINARLFKAAAISSCCLDPNTVMAYGGSAWAESSRGMGFPSLVNPDPAFWAPMSLAQNADRIRTPILMQLADREFLLAMEAFEALRERGRPVEMLVFPGEYHGKWQPAHRLAAYDRAVDWFAFWLKGEENGGSAKRDQYRRWENIRASLPAN